jgi:hypothetical protein
MEKFKCTWNDVRQCWRLVHPETGDFIAEFYTEDLILIVTKHKKTATISLGDLLKASNLE